MQRKGYNEKEKAFVYIQFTNVCKQLSVCRCEDRHCKCEEGFFGKVIKKGVYIINVSVKVRWKTKFQFDFKPLENMEIKSQSSLKLN